jgi:integrase
MTRRNRARLPRDVAVREPYEPETPQQEAARKLDAVLGIEQAKEDGWRVVQRVKDAAAASPRAKPPVAQVVPPKPPKPERPHEAPKVVHEAPSRRDEELSEPEELEMPDDGAGEPPEDDKPAQEPSHEEVDTDTTPEPTKKPRKERRERTLERAIKKPKKGRQEQEPPADKADRDQDETREREEHIKRRLKERRLKEIERQRESAPVQSAAEEPAAPRPGRGLGKPGRPPKKPRVTEGAVPFTAEDLTKIVTKIPKTKRWIRNRALILLGVSAGLRSAELVTVRLEGMSFNERGLVIAVKTPTGEIEMFQIPRTGGRLCTVAAVARWIVSSGIKGGHVFRVVHAGGVVDGDPDSRLTPRQVGDVVRKAAELAELPNPATYTGLSLRASYGEAVRRAAERAMRNIDTVRRSMRPHVAE